jgi:hypothetical protein
MMAMLTSLMLRKLLQDAVTEAAAALEAAKLAAEAPTFTALELQTAATAAANAVTTFIVVNGTNTEILQDLRTAINAFIAADGNIAAELADDTTIAVLRADILALLNEDQLDEVAIDALILVIAGMVLAPVEEDEPTATEQAIIDLLTLAADRVALDVAVVATEEAFGLTATGSVLNTVLDLAAERTALIDVVTDAAADLVEATATVAAVTLLAEGSGRLGHSSRRSPCCYSRRCTRWFGCGTARHKHLYRG